jgi:O-succinylbenzoate synthase
MNRESLNNFLKAELSLSSLELIVAELPQKTVFRSAIGERKSRKALLVKWVDTEGDFGIGECSCRPDPFYSHEFVDGAIAIVKDYIFPLIQGVTSYGELLTQMNRVRGWNFTRAAVEFAANDLIRRKTGIGLLEATGIKPLNRVPVGISLGLFSSADELISKLDELADSGYQRLKFKITKGYNDAGILSAFYLPGDMNVAFDANGAFDADGFTDLNRFAELGRIIEQPYPPTHLYLHQEYLKNYKDFRMCLDEEVESYGNLVAHSLEMQQLNIKPGRVGGLWTTVQMIDYCNNHGIDAWVGGMFETSIGRSLNLQVASLLPEAKAHDLSPSSRYFKQDLVTNSIEMRDGFIDHASFAHVEIDQAVLKDLTVDYLILKN